MHYLITLANGNDPISVVTPKVAKSSTIVTVGCHCCWCYHLKYNANVHEPLAHIHSIKVLFTYLGCYYFKVFDENL